MGIGKEEMVDFHLPGLMMLFSFSSSKQQACILAFKKRKKFRTFLLSLLLMQNFSIFILLIHLFPQLIHQFSVLSEFICSPHKITLTLSELWLQY